MSCRFIRLMLVAVCLLAFPSRSPAPLIYRPGEGWTYEPVGGVGECTVETRDAFPSAVVTSFAEDLSGSPTGKVTLALR